MPSQVKGWEPLEVRRTGARAFQVTPFMRLARAHVASTAGNALVVLALAGSILLVDPAESRSRVALTLALTMVPFALLAPMVGPWLDRLRGGRRWVIVGANALRALVSLLLVREIAVLDKDTAGVTESVLPYVLAFVLLIADKSYHLAKSALVPSTVHSDEELVQANSLLTRLSGIAGVGAAVPGAIAMGIANSVDGFGPGQAVMALATVVFAVAAVAGAQIPKTRVADDRTTTQERQELRGGAILLAASAMGLMRGILGFIVFLLTFWLQELRHSEDWEAWQISFEVGAILGASVVGPLLGTLVAPALRRANVGEERILQVALGVVAAMGLVGLYLVVGPNLPALAAPILVLSVGTATSSAKLAFDSIVQRDAPDANRGRAFARFETRFQLVWVVGAFIPVLATDLILPDRLWTGFLAVTGCAVFGLVSYLAGVNAVAAGQPVPQRKLTKNLQHKLKQRSRSRKQKGSEAKSLPSGSPAPPAPAPEEVDPRLPPTPPPPEDDDTTVVIDPTKLH